MRDPSDPVRAAEGVGAAAVFPVVAPPRDGPAGVGLVGWIPDFQHIAMPENFSETEISERDLAFQRIAERCDRVVVSSEAVARDFRGQFPLHVDKLVVVPFPSKFAMQELSPVSTAVAQKYSLPTRFLLCANQFWTHKNHLLLIQAVAMLKARGTPVTVALTGLLADYRDPTLSLLSELVQSIASAGVHEQVRILGLVPASDFDDLIREAHGVVQPSGYEGWSTTVEDAKALGKPLICSDIAVHREQAPDALALFSLDAESLADALSALWETPQQESAVEVAALERARAGASLHGGRLRRACLDAARASR